VPPGRSARILQRAARRKGAKAAGQAVRLKADEAYQDLHEFFAALRPVCSYQEIADILNAQCHTTRYGKPWTDVAVWRACKRMGIPAQMDAIDGARL